MGEQLAHVHNVRLMWLKEAAPELMEGLAKVEKDAAADPALLRRSLEASAAAVSALLARALAAGGKVRGFKPHAAAFLGYLVAHESHHRGQVALTLKQAGHPLDRKTAFGLWEWGTALRADACVSRIPQLRAPRSETGGKRIGGAGAAAPPN